MKNRYKGLIGIFIVIVIIIGIGIWHYYTHNLNQFDTTSQPRQVINLQSKDRKSSQIEYDFIHRTGCPHCQKVAPSIIPSLRRLSRNKKHLIVINSISNRMQPLLIHESVTESPTIILRYHGYQLYQYTGTNDTIFRQLLHGVNPRTDRKFPLKDPKKSYDENDYNHTQSIRPASSDKSFLANPNLTSY